MHFLPREIPAAMHVVKERTLTIARNCQNVVEVGWRDDADDDDDDHDQRNAVWLSAGDAAELAESWSILSTELGRVSPVSVESI